MLEVVIKFVVIGEVFTHLLRRYPSAWRTGQETLTGVGILLGLRQHHRGLRKSTASWIISTTRVLGRSASVVQCGLIVFLFLFAAHFHLKWERPVFGIALGLGITCQRLVLHVGLCSRSGSSGRRATFSIS